MIFTVTVEVQKHEGIADPEGQTIERLLPALGYEKVSGLRIGRLVRFEIEAASKEEARQDAERLSAKLLSNPVIETARVAVDEAPAR